MIEGILLVLDLVSLPWRPLMHAYGIPWFGGAKSSFSSLGLPWMWCLRDGFGKQENPLAISNLGLGGHQSSNPNA